MFCTASVRHVTSHQVVTSSVTPVTKATQVSTVRGKCEQIMIPTETICLVCIVDIRKSRHKNWGCRRHKLYSTNGVCLGELTHIQVGKDDIQVGKDDILRSLFWYLVVVHPFVVSVNIFRHSLK